MKFQEHFRDYKINVYHGLACEDIMFEGKVDSPKRINLLYDDFERHYHVFVSMTGAMARRYVCKACNKGVGESLRNCDQTCSDCMASQPSAFSAIRITCAECNSHFRSQASFANHKQSTSNKKSICERRRCCATCGALETRGNHECNKRYCESVTRKEM